MIVSIAFHSFNLGPFWNGNWKQPLAKSGRNCDMESKDLAALFCWFCNLLCIVVYYSIKHLKNKLKTSYLIIVYIVEPAKLSATSRPWSSVAARKFTWTVYRRSCQLSAVPYKRMFSEVESALSFIAWLFAWRKKSFPSFHPLQNTCSKTVKQKTSRNSSLLSTRSQPNLRYHMPSEGGERPDSTVRRPQD